MKAVFKLSTIILFFALLMFSCKPDYEKIFKENNDEFDENRLMLNETIIKIENNYLKKWNRSTELILEVNDLDETTKKNLKKIGVKSIVISKNTISDCNKNYNIVFNVIEDWNINTLFIVQLVYAPCSIEGEKRDRKKRLNYNMHQDFWGQGGGWFIYSDTDRF